MSTLKRIANVVGCSISTVSKAMNNCHDVSAQTRERVMEVAKILGYYERKKRIKTENRKKKEFNIAIICPEVESDYYDRYIVCFSKYLAVNNHRTLIYNHNFNYRERDRLLEMCKDACDIDGIICLSRIELRDDYRRIPIAYYGKNASDHISFECDHIAGMDAVIKLIGNKKGNSVMFVGESHTQDKEANCRSVVKNYSNVKFSSITLRERFDEAGYEAAKIISKKEKLPTVIVCAYDEIALGLIDGLQKNGIKVPEDVSVVGINDIPCAKYCFGGLSTIGFDTEDACREIVSALLKNIENGTDEASHHLIKSKFIKRNT